MAKKKTALSDSLESARQRLSQNGNRLTLILALLVWLISFLFYRLFYLAIAVLVALFSIGDGGVLLLFCTYWGIVLLFTLFVVMPLFYGILQMALRMSRGEEVFLAMIFDGFSSGKVYRRAVKLSDEGVVGSLAVTSLLSFVICGIISSFWETLIGTLVCVGIVLVAVCVWFLFESRRFFKLGLALSHPDTPPRELRPDVKKARRQNPRIAFRYWRFFFPRILLGFLTIGIYLLAEVLPLMILTYFCEYEKTQNLMKQLEEIDHE